jgi:hypothetical protein
MRVGSPVLLVAAAPVGSLDSADMAAGAIGSFAPEATAVVVAAVGKVVGAVHRPAVGRLGQAREQRILEHMLGAQALGDIQAEELLVGSQAGVAPAGNQLELLPAEILVEGLDTGWDTDYHRTVLEVALDHGNLAEADSGL